MREKNDWRLTNQEKFLKGVRLVWHSYSPANPKNDHDHCEFCFAEFMRDPVPETLQAGYSTEDRERWVCKPCFDDFADLFHWQV
jgi:hypothetical protein